VPTWSEPGVGGALAGLRVVELVGLGPGPFCGMMLADLGADVIRIERPAGDGVSANRSPVLSRGQRSLALDLKSSAGAPALRRIARGADVFIDPYRPGVADRLGVGPEALLAANPRLVYGQMSGWGQRGPWAGRAGHDITYLALSGVLDLVGPAERPSPPLNLLADFGGGALMLTIGIQAAVLNARQTGLGQVVDAAMIDGAAVLTAMVHELRHSGSWRERGDNVLDGGAPYYDVYRTADDRFVAVGAIERPFFARLLDGLGVAVDDPIRGSQRDPVAWPQLRDRLRAEFAAETQAHWTEVFAALDACVAPVLTLDDAYQEPQLAERGTYLDAFGVRQPAPAPRLSRTPSAIRSGPPAVGQHSVGVLAEAGFTAQEIDDLLRSGAVFASDASTVNAVSASST
jgi:alpha-methylacyl-CoA racemase